MAYTSRHDWVASSTRSACSKRAFEAVHIAVHMSRAGLRTGSARMRLPPPMIATGLSVQNQTTHTAVCEQAARLVDARVRALSPLSPAPNSPPRAMQPDQDTATVAARRPLRRTPHTVHAAYGIQDKPHPCRCRAGSRRSRIRCASALPVHTRQHARMHTHTHTHTGVELESALYANTIAEIERYIVSRRGADARCAHVDDASRCTIGHHVAPSGMVLHHRSSCCTIGHHVAPSCIMLHHRASCCDMPRHRALHTVALRRYARPLVRLRCVARCSRV